MRINIKKRISPLALGAIIVALIILGAGSVFAYQTLINPNNNGSDTTSSEEEPIPNTPTTIPDTKGGEQFTDPELSDDEGTPAPNLTSMQITALNQTDDTLQIRTLIQAIWSTGSCELTLSNGASVVERRVDVQALPSSSTCKGFDIPLTELSGGEWSVNITATRDSDTATASIKVTVQ